jgi:hypothetical protein
MSSSPSMSHIGRVCMFVGAAVFAVGSVCAQSSPSPNPSVPYTASANESSSVQLLAENGFDGGGGAALPSSSAVAGDAASAQQEHGYKQTFFPGGPAFEIGGGFNAPIGNDTPYITWGGNFTGGAGMHFSRRFSLLGEFQFMDNKLPAAFINAGNGGAGGPGAGGNSHIISITADPLIDLFPKATNSAYVTGGAGWYHKSTNFTETLCCDFYGFPVTFTANSFSSNQFGVNFGIGFTHRVGGAYATGNMKLFGEARYVYLHTPPITQPNGLGTTELIPVTFGLRW